MIFCGMTESLLIFVSTFHPIPHRIEEQIIIKILSQYLYWKSIIQMCPQNLFYFIFYFDIYTRSIDQHEISRFGQQLGHIWKPMKTTSFVNVHSHGVVDFLIQSFSFLSASPWYCWYVEAKGKTEVAKEQSNQFDTNVIKHGICGPWRNADPCNLRQSCVQNVGRPEMNA